MANFHIGDIVIVKPGSKSAKWVKPVPLRVTDTIRNTQRLEILALDGSNPCIDDGEPWAWRRDCVHDPFLNGAVKAIAALKEGKNGKEK